MTYFQCIGCNPTASNTRIRSLIKEAFAACLALSLPVLVFYLAYRFETSSEMTSGRQTLKTGHTRWPTSPFFSEYESPYFLVVYWWNEHVMLFPSLARFTRPHLFLHAGVAEKGFTAEGIAGAKSRFFDSVKVCPCL